jgi:hypothetical protein
VYSLDLSVTGSYKQTCGTSVEQGGIVTDSSYHIRTCWQSGGQPSYDSELIKATESTACTTLIVVLISRHRRLFTKLMHPASIRCFLYSCKDMIKDVIAETMRQYPLRLAYPK